MYCRFCTRKRATMVRGGWDAISRNDERMIEYVRDHPEIRDVIVSGGDPLTLPVAKLRFFLDNLAAIPHVDVIRIGTRVPVTLPQKLYDQELIDLLASAEKVWIQTHFNHPREITPEAARVCKALLRAGMPVNNHTVLLKGVNDSLETMRRLMRGLLRIKVRPYYLFHCDPVIGAGHFRTSVWKGLEIMEGLRGHMSGLGIPTYVVDSPHGGGKIPLMPNYLVSASDDAVVLRNYEGMLVRYQAEDKPNTVQPTATRGVSSLLQGSKSVIMPENNERMARRKLHRPGQPSRRTQRLERHHDRSRQRLLRRQRPSPRNGSPFAEHRRGVLRMRIGITYDLKSDAPSRRDVSPRRSPTTSRKSSTARPPSRPSPRCCAAWAMMSSNWATAGSCWSGSWPSRRISSSTSPRGRGSAARARRACRPCWRCSASPTPAPIR